MNIHFYCYGDQAVPYTPASGFEYDDLCEDLEDEACEFNTGPLSDENQLIHALDLGDRTIEILKSALGRVA